MNRIARSQRFYKEAKKIIPGGTQLLSKRPEMFHPELWPAYYEKAKGCEVWDLDGNRYIDMGYMGVGSCILGYADRDVDDAVKGAIKAGTMSTLNCPEEVELAKTLCEIHPWAGMARFARTGGEAMAVAVRIARANTGKDKILFCGYHGWHDWYLAANIKKKAALDKHLLRGLDPKGVPYGLRGTALPFGYNDIDGFKKQLNSHKGEIAAVVMEPLRSRMPKDGFLETIRRETRKNGIVLIFDEITAGWRMCEGGSHLYFNIFPDMAVFAKGLSNGYSMAAIIGNKKVMKSAKDAFISSTYWTERIGPVAALATIRKMRDLDVPEYIKKIGKKVKDGWRENAQKYGLNIDIWDMDSLTQFSFNEKNPLKFKAVFVGHMLKEGFLAATGFYASLAHNDKHVKMYLKAVDGAFDSISKVIRLGKKIKAPVLQTGFKRLT